MLKGKKTYLIALAVAILTIAVQLGFLSQDIANTLFGLLGAGGLASLRLGIENS
jgi:threonine/homoserine efflux transporter RhtA